MTRSDKWRKRPVVLRYFEYAEKLRLLSPESNWEKLSIHFVMPMPSSWSKKKKDIMRNKPHKQKPDLDNLIKAYQDSLLKDDSRVWKYGVMMKTWGDEGCIILNPKLIPIKTNL